MSNLEPSHRRQIERELGRPLVDDELRVVASFEELSEAQRDVLRKLGTRPIGLAFLHTIVPGVREGMKKLDALERAPYRISVPTWGRESGLGRWRFRILPAHGEAPLDTVRRCVDTIVARAEPFGRVERVTTYVPPAELVLHAYVETERGPVEIRPAGGITFRIVDETVELVFLLDTDIHAYVSHQFIDNTALAIVNAPRLAQFLGMLGQELGAHLIESNGLLPADETGFTAR